MKMNLFDLFDGYEGELPEITEAPCDPDSITQLVMQKTAAPRIRQTRKKRLPAMIAAAAAAVAMCGVTAAAVTGKLDLFRNVLGRTVLSDAQNLPLTGNQADSAAMVPFMQEGTAVFAGDSSLQIETVGMYSDNNTVMLTLEIQPQDGQTLPADALFIPYFYGADGRLIEGGIGKTEQLVQGDTENA